MNVYLANNDDIQNTFERYDALINNKIPCIFISEVYKKFHD